MKTRVGVIGAGIYGSVLINAYYGAHRQGLIDFVAVSDIKPEALEEVRRRYGIKGYSDYKEMLDREKPDAVAVVTPDYLHEACVLEAARRGVHILVQKPISTEIEAGKRMIRAAREAGVMLYVDYHKRFDPGHVQLKHAIEEGKLGQILYGHVCMEDKILVPTQWFKTWAHKSSPGWFLGVHFYDLIYWLLGEKPHRVYATAHRKKLVSMGIDTLDALQAKFEFPGGATVSVDASWIIPDSFASVVNQQIRLVGTEGLQEVDSQDRGVLAAYTGEPYQVINPYGRLDIEDPQAGLIPTGYTIESMLYFLRLVNMMKAENLPVASLKAPYPTGEEALVATIMCQRAHESAAAGKVVDISY